MFTEQMLYLLEIGNYKKDSEKDWGNKGGK